MTYLQKMKEIAAEPDNRFIIEDTRGWLADIIRVAAVEAAKPYSSIIQQEKLGLIDEMKAEFNGSYPPLWDLG
jgi:hypothetical protein